MSEEGMQLMRSAQCARIIICISEMHDVTYNEAVDMFYSSETANMIEDRVADLHCRSDKYLAEEIWNEHITSNGSATY